MQAPPLRAFYSLFFCSLFFFHSVFSLRSYLNLRKEKRKRRKEKIQKAFERISVKSAGKKIQKENTKGVESVRREKEKERKREIHEEFTNHKYKITAEFEII